MLRCANAGRMRRPVAARKVGSRGVSCVLPKEVGRGPADGLPPSLKAIGWRDLEQPAHAEVPLG
jgi:hypothetical protein